MGIGMAARQGKRAVSAPCALWQTRPYITRCLGHRSPPALAVMGIVSGALNEAQLASGQGFRHRLGVAVG